LQFFSAGTASTTLRLPCAEHNIDLTSPGPLGIV